jgi:hypothetical protein
MQSGSGMQTTVRVDEKKKGDVCVFAKTAKVTLTLTLTLPLTLRCEGC